jgi:radical SAM superfamily enzyme YgiQ (UPF0313 family)
MAKINASDSSVRDATRTLLLVVPPQRGLLEGFSTGLIAIANYVRQHAHTVEVRLLDFGLLNEKHLGDPVSQALLSAKGRVFVGITGTTASYQSMLATARAFKAAEPSCVVVLGGHHVSPQDNVVLSHHADIVDFVIRGEGEVALAELLTHYPEVDKVPNLSHLVQGRLRRNTDGPLLVESALDLLSPTFGHEGLRSAAGKFDHQTYVSARGCPLSCAFCVVRATAIRAKSIDAIISDLRYLVGSLGYTELAIEDNFFAHQPKRTLALCAAIEKLRNELQFSWDCQTRIESMRRADVVQAMSRAGCTAAYLGAESLIPKHLRYLDKTPHPEKYLEALSTTVVPLMLESGIDVYLNLQLGLPGDTPDDRKQTIVTLTKLGTLASAHGRNITVFPQLNVIYPGTPHFDMAVEKGYFGSLGQEVFEEFTAWEADEEPILHYLGEHFAHGVGGIPLGILDRTQLAAGRFSVCARGLSTISTQLRRMDEVPGIRVFRYGRYLTHEQLPANAYA